MTSVIFHVLFFPVQPLDEDNITIGLSKNIDKIKYFAEDVGPCSVATNMVNNI